MKNRIFLKTVFGVAAAMLLNLTLFGQTTFVDDDYEEYDSDTQTPTNIDYVTLKTGGTTMGYYALPDPVYHPDYNAGDGWVLTAGFSWNWTAPTDPGTAPNLGGGSPANYVEIEYLQAGDYEINVTEEAPASFGGCEDASPTVMNVSVIAPPTGTISVNPGGSWQEIAADQSYQICGDQLAQTVTISFNEAVPDALASYAFQITETIELLDGDGNVISVEQSETVIQDFPLDGKLKGSNLGTLTNAAFVTTTPDFTFTFDTDALDILQDGGTDARTRYTYRVTRTGDAAQNGLVSNISHKSDYLAGSVSYYDFTNQTVSFVVNPTPSTGPIYSVPNTFNY
ncbi:MAG: hypothetical protein JXA61_01490 [Bacteroidales bacterium]|nr:hypothetical protein [Bacteroidales bacterium]